MNMFKFISTGVDIRPILQKITHMLHSRLDSETIRYYRLINMRLLSPRQIYGVITLKFKCLFIFSLVFMNMRSPEPEQAIANDIFPTQTCQQLANGNYAVIIDKPVNQLPQLPEFLAVSVLPCRYFTASMTFLGSFKNVNTSIYRAGHIRNMGLDAVVHSFTDKKVCHKVHKLFFTQI